MLDQWIESRYNYTTYSDNHDLLLYNSYSGVCYKVNGEDQAYILEILSSEEFRKSHVIPEELITGGFLIPIYADEDRMLEDLFEQSKSSSLLELCIIPTEQCNFRCQYCFELLEDAPKGIMSEEIQDAVVRYVYQKLPRYQGLQVTFFGGEPLLAMSAVRRLSRMFMEACKAMHKFYSAVIVTNGYLLTKDIFEELLSYRVIYYQITLDGCKDTHDAQRYLIDKRGSFERITKNLRDIRSGFPLKHFTIAIRTNVTKAFLCEMQGYVDFISQLIDGDKRFKIYFVRAEDYDGSISEQAKDILLDKESRSKYDDLLLCEKMMDLLPDNQLIESAFFENRLRPLYGMCGYMKDDCIAVSVTGKVYKCGTFFQGKPDLSVGQVENGKITINMYKKSKWQMHLSQFDERCGGCLIRPVCLVPYCIYWNYMDNYVTPGRFRKTTCSYREKRGWDKILKLYDRYGGVKQLHVNK